MTTPCTILIPTKDRPKLLRRAIASALNAAPNAAEILIIDDKSDVPARNVVNEFDDPRLALVVNDGPNGAAAARNYGMQVARGEVVFFLDDDDELLAGYCDTVLNSVLPTHPNIAYGFSACRIAGKDPENESGDTVENNKLPNGIVANTAPFRRKLSGFGMGFWIKRDVFEELGPIDEALATNEDTEYVCRLIDAAKLAWFTTQPGVRLHTQATDTKDNTLDHVTMRTHSADRANCFLTIFNRYQRLITSDIEARRHLARRYIKLSTKSGRFGESWQFAGSLPNLSERISARYYAVVNFVAYRLSGKHPKT